MSHHKAVAWRRIMCGFCRDDEPHLLVDKFGFSSSGELIIKAFCLNCEKLVRVLHKAEEIVDDINQAMLLLEESQDELSEEEIKQFRSGLDQAGVWDELLDEEE